MIDHTHTGVRCHTRHVVCTVKGTLPRNSQGTVVCEITSLDHPLILVCWDIGLAVPVFPDEIELEDQ